MTVNASTHLTSRLFLASSTRISCGREEDVRRGKEIENPQPEKWEEGKSNCEQRRGRNFYSSEEAWLTLLLGLIAIISGLEIEI